MQKTTVYLTPELRSAIKHLARELQVTEAEVIRESIRRMVGRDRPRPRGALFESGRSIAREVDSHLSDFGER